MKEHIDTVHILGLGALGSMYAARLFDLHPASVKIIAGQERVSTFRRDGLSVNGKTYTFDFVVPGEEAHTSGEGLHASGEGSHASADLIIIAVKASQLQQGIRDISGFVGKDTIVLSLLNGISSEEEIGREIGMEHLLYAYGLGMDAVRQGNRVSYKNAGKIVFGEKNNEVLSKRVQAVAALFDRAGIAYHIPVNMYKALWSKFMMNTGINQASAILRAPYGLFQQNEEAYKLMVMAAQEVITLSRHAGIHLEQSDLDEVVRVLHTLNPTGKTSMLQDMEAGRKSEVDLFSGTVIELGKRYGVPTPVNELFFLMIRAMEEMAAVKKTIPAEQEA